MDLVLHKVYEQMKLCYVISIVHFAAQKKKKSGLVFIWYT